MEGPADWLPKARYAVEMLLLGLGLAPAWVEREELPEGALYYGPELEAAEGAAVRIRLAPETTAYFEAPHALDPARWGTLRWEGTDWPLPFGASEQAVIANQDVIASAFYWLAGVAEATTPDRNVHGRYPYEASPQAALDSVLLPAVDAYRAWLGERLDAQGIAIPGRTWEGKPCAVALTHDVDFVRLHRFGAFARGVRARDWSRASEAFTRLDPRRDSLHRLHDDEALRGVTATYFVKAGASAPEDVPYRLDVAWLRAFLADLQRGGFEIGLHPSYHAHDHAERLAEEHDRLASVLDARPEAVRMHFLRWTAPTTPRLLDAAGFRLDSTLGFSAHEGFRRATSHPFRLYDLGANRPLDLWEVPLAVMDTTLFTHHQLAPDAAETRIAAVLQAVKRVGGCAVLLWHSTLYDERRAPGQGTVFERTLDRALAEGAHVGSLRDVLAAWS
ncbi:MAG: hypothetical protein HKN04_06245 [Rhodothermaceae bacterium]|nr:hypothetical protein [Rhodothermaceae bacterium]